jgi:predicted dehydrogenase
MIGWGIIGCGDVANRKVAPALARIPNAHLVSVMRRNKAAADEFAQRHGATHSTNCAKDTIDHPDVDVVYIATPPAFHLTYALAVAAAGKPCVVEKPAGRSLAEFRRMRDAFRARSLPLYVSYYRRHLPRFRKLVEILRSDRLGPVRSFDYRMNKQPAPKAFDLEETGGGAFYGLACHMLDLFDDFFGPLEYLGGAATNTLPKHPSEDCVTMSFKCAQEAVGSAIWNFAAIESSDELRIDCARGHITMKGMSTSGTIKIVSRDVGERKNQKKRKGIFRAFTGKSAQHQQTLRFAREPAPHRSILTMITQDLVAQSGQDNADAALRTAELVDAVLAPFYDGREDAFWLCPARHQTQLRRARPPMDSDKYRLSDEQLKCFREQGFIAPLDCEADLKTLTLPEGAGRNLHLEDPAVLSVCLHPSITHRVAQVMGSQSFKLFKSRFPVKESGSEKVIAWHQDVGKRNGGFTPEGDPVPTVAVWMALDDVDLENGGLEIIQGSHRGVIGDYDLQTKSRLLESGALRHDEVARALPVKLRAGQFILYHAWLLHYSGPNRSPRRRAAMNMRFVMTGMEFEHDSFEYLPVDVPMTVTPSPLYAHPASASSQRRALVG